MNIIDVENKLKKLGKKEVIQIKKSFGISPSFSYGIFLKDLKKLAKHLPKNEYFVKELFHSKVYEAKLLIPMLLKPESLSKALMKKWVKSFDNWEICDTFCMGFFGKSQYAYEMAFEWSSASGEFKKRAGFVCMVSYAFTNKTALDEEVRRFFKPIFNEANDDRKYVMKGVNWALRQIGKRNRVLHSEALKIADKILKKGTPSCQWIARDAIAQLTRKKVAFKHYPKQG